MAAPASGRADGQCRRWHAGQTDARRGLAIIYLDASILVGLFIHDAATGKAEELVSSSQGQLVVSDFGSLEFASAISRRVRMREVDVPTAESVFSAYDTWLKEVPAQASLIPADLAVAASYLRRLNSPLRGPDAVNIALAARIGAELATFDNKMAAAAEVLGVPVAKAP